jgi:hypothetical protein
MPKTRKKAKPNHPWKLPWSKKSQSNKDVEGWEFEGRKLHNKPIKRDTWRNDVY